MSVSLSIILVSLIALHRLVELNEILSFKYCRPWVNAREEPPKLTFVFSQCILYSCLGVQPHRNFVDRSMALREIARWHGPVHEILNIIFFQKHL